MNFKLIYVSPNGTTRITTRVLKEEIERDGHMVELVDIGRKPHRENHHTVLEKLEEADIVGFGAPAYHMDMLEPMKRLFREILSSGGRYKFKSFLYLNYAGITSGKAFLNTARLLHKVPVPIIGAIKVAAPHFHHMEKLSAESIQDFIQRFYYEMKEKGFAPVPWDHLFDILSPQKFRVNLIYPLTHLIGKMRELRITVSKETCKKCGKCAAECPAGAISLDDYASIDLKKCIHCYHCIMACKLNSIEAPVDRLEKMIKINIRLIGTENPQNRIYI